ncbi:DUF6118 family protein [Sphingomonas sp. AR_OL41]|uniref:DUF6118 family protein n=1 Tax=Sphingomonas sp. AR_OL41 TaxID=3042729 RepID=UPI00247FD086|nr:DUF6118 family protein [Sphingomonas sp. AR_OL41]MDH7974484.1 DUF6118 family protein [Sphingomonas sp. AR_OL41]
MNELVSTSAASSASANDPVAAFERMSHRIAGLTAAVEGFAARQQELHARDYGPDLAKIHKRQDDAKEAILVLADRPGVKLTPRDIAEQIGAAAAQVRERDHHALVEAHRAQLQATRALDAVVASALTAQLQRRWLWGAAAGAFLLGIVVCAIIPGVVDSSVPTSWMWPEQRAAAVLGTDGWSAGMRLMQVSDPRQWRALREAAQLSAANADALRACRERAAGTKKASACVIRVEPAKMTQ